MGDGAIVGLLPYLQSAPFLLALVVVSRLWVQEIRRSAALSAALDEERKDHSQTQWQLDTERTNRRAVEDKMDLLTREVRGLKAEVTHLRGQLSEAT